MPSPRKPIRKADDLDPNRLVALYDKDCNLVGVAPASKIIPVEQLDADQLDPAPAPASSVGTPADGVAKAAADLKKSLYTHPDPAEQNRIATDMQTRAIATLHRIHHGPRSRT